MGLRTPSSSWHMCPLDSHLGIRRRVGPRRRARSRWLPPFRRGEAARVRGHVCHRDRRRCGANDVRRSGPTMGDSSAAARSLTQRQALSVSRVRQCDVRQRAPCHPLERGRYHGPRQPRDAVRAPPSLGPFVRMVRVGERQRRASVRWPERPRLDVATVTPLDRGHSSATQLLLRLSGAQPDGRWPVRPFELPHLGGDSSKDRSCPLAHLSGPTQNFSMEVPKYGLGVLGGDRWSGVGGRDDWIRQHSRVRAVPARTAAAVARS
jgi:hypothetical protein